MTDLNARYTGSMKKIVPFVVGTARLIRLPNVLIIILTQVLLRYGILRPLLFADDTNKMSGLPDFSILVVVTILLAIGGYIINDYFDVRIDHINKPEKRVIDKFVSARSAITLHLIITGMAVCAGFYLAFRLQSLSFGFIFPCIAMLLWLYSARYKRSLLWGNLIVAFLSALVIFIVWLFEFLDLRLNPGNFSSVLANFKSINLFFIAYGLFAFLTTLFREIIKDVEDMDGDKEYSCSTIPLTIGVKKTKYIIFSIILLTIALLVYGQVVVYWMDLQIVFWYLLFVVQIPFLILVFKLSKAQNREDFHYLGNLSKLIMLAGILSMQLISISI
jgi:4-hydroxybenzoate polyprenyltransferase